MILPVNEEIKKLEEYNMKVIFALSDFMKEKDLWEEFYSFFDKKYPEYKAKGK